METSTRACETTARLRPQRAFITVEEEYATFFSVTDSRGRSPRPSVNYRRNAPREPTASRLVILGDIREDLVAQRGQLLPRNSDFETAVRAATR